ncbi:MAG: uroporphyrinogen-III C-methyltransferase [Deltaproteobacteria bacterium]|nr:uroporphyrinogen-III C-methyltransferase [Deltaproteobacteria bacterium]
MAKRRTGHGKVWLVGAGPGDPELLTLKAVRALSEADVVAYDELISEEILALAPAHAERIAVGRRANGCRHHDEKIHPAVIARARAGDVVVRLKGGDPLVFGRGGEEAEELASAGVPFEIVPGISAALGAAAASGIPLTHRGAASSVTFATAHAAHGDGDPKLATTVPITGTIVLYMGLGRLAETAASLVAAGRAPETPVAVIAHATRATERKVIGTLATIADEVARAALPAPALIVVGEVVGRAVESPLAEVLAETGARLRRAG